MCHTLFSSTTSPLTTAVVEEVETPSHDLMLSVLADQGVGEFTAQPLLEVHDSCETETYKTVRANPDSSEFKESREMGMCATTPVESTKVPVSTLLVDPNEVDDAYKITDSHEVTVCANSADENANRSLPKLLENSSEATDSTVVRDSSTLNMKGNNVVKEFHD